MAKAPRIGEVTTVNYGWTKPTVGASDDVWGGLLNTDLDGIDTTVKSVSNVANAAQASLTSYLPLSGGTLTGALTPVQTAGIVGTTTNNNAAAGAIGEYVGASATAIALTTGTQTNLTSISLTAGDWDVSGSIIFTNNTGGFLGNIQAGVSTTTATLPAAPQGYAILLSGTSSAFPQQATLSLAVFRLSLAVTTTVYLVGYAQFASGATNGAGFVAARRAR